MRLTWKSPFRLLAALSRAVRTFFTDDPVLATPGVQSVRETRCLGCDKFKDDQCTLCTCVVALKTVMASETCPDNPPKWRKQTRFSTGL